jgi:hypothetical protein
MRACACYNTGIATHRVQTMNHYTIRINEQQLTMLNEAMRDLVVKHSGKKMDKELFDMMMLRTMLVNDEDTRLSKVQVNDFTQ